MKSDIATDIGCNIFISVTCSAVINHQSKLMITTVFEEAGHHFKSTKHEKNERPPYTLTTCVLHIIYNCTDRHIQKPHTPFLPPFPYSLPYTDTDTRVEVDIALSSRKGK